MSTNVELFSSIDQIKLQNNPPIEVNIEDRDYSDDFTLFEGEKITLDVMLEVKKSSKKVKVKLLSGYDNELCENLELNNLEVREIEEYLSNNLLIKY